LMSRSTPTLYHGKKKRDKLKGDVSQAQVRESVANLEPKSLKRRLRSSLGESETRPNSI
jgi:hypothetical protein